MKPEMKKLIIVNLPYLLFVYLFGKLGQTYRLAAGADVSEKLLHLADGFSLAFENAAPSFHLFDLAVGVAGAVALRLMVYPQDRPEQKCAGDRRFRQRQDPVLCEAQPHAVRVQGLPDLIRDYRPERKSDRRGGPAPCTVRLPTSIRKRTF